MSYKKLIVFFDTDSFQRELSVLLNFDNTNNEKASFSTHHSNELNNALTNSKIVKCGKSTK